MYELIVATKNPGKFKEVVEALSRPLTGQAGLNFKSHFLGDIAASGGGFNDDDFVEDGKTFEDNSRKKAEYYFKRLKDQFEPGKLLVLGEDSGIIVDALAGELGVKTRRWGAGEQASDEEWIKYFLGRMKGVPVDGRGAEFVCSACLKGIDSGGEEIFENFLGETRGVITNGLEAPLQPGIPLSSCFRPEGFDRVYAALSVEEKNKISHRGKAMKGVREFLSSYSN